MLHISKRIESLAALGDWLKRELSEISTGKTNELLRMIEKAGVENPWFTKTAVIQSLDAIAGWLNVNTLQSWVQPYFLTDPVQPKKVAVIMAGNIPMVNFHDFLCVLVTGNQFLGKLSSQDKVLLPFVAQRLIEIDGSWKEQIVFTEERLDGFEAVIATGSNNTGRYFDYYFGKYPHIIRKSRHSLAILWGTERNDELRALYDDIFQYYGMGCRNVSMLLVRQGYNFPELIDKWEGLARPTEHNKYLNNYDYYRSFYLVNLQPFFDTGYVSILQNDSVASPVSVIHYKEFENDEELVNFVKMHDHQIQCIVSSNPVAGIQTVLPGNTQCPGLNDYPDGVDVIQFLLAL